MVPLDAINRIDRSDCCSEDGRRPYADIAKEVGLSEAAVRQRVHRLVDSGVIQIVAVTDQIQMGFARAGDARGDGRAATWTRPLRRSPRSTRSTTWWPPPAGSTSSLRSLAVDDQHLYEIVNRIRAVDGVRHAETYVYFKIHKQTYQWGAR